MSTGTLEAGLSNRQAGMKLNTKKLRTARYLMTYGAKTPRLPSKPSMPRLPSRRSSVVSTEDKLLAPAQSRRTLSLIPQKCMQPGLRGATLKSFKAQINLKLKSRELSKQAHLRPLVFPKSSKANHKKKKSERFEMTGSKTTRTTSQTSKPDDSLINLLEALDRLPL
jgi:hypothetical protein